MPPTTLRNAAGLYNLTRDFGGAIGLATIVTLVNERVHFHWNRLIENVNPARPVVQQFLEATGAGPAIMCVLSPKWLRKRLKG